MGIRTDVGVWVLPHLFLLKQNVKVLEKLCEKGLNNYYGIIKYWIRYKEGISAKAKQLVLVSKEVSFAEFAVSLRKQNKLF